MTHLVVHGPPSTSWIAFVDVVSATAFFAIDCTEMWAIRPIDVALSLGFRESPMFVVEPSAVEDEAQFEVIEEAVAEAHDDVPEVASELTITPDCAAVLEHPIHEDISLGTAILLEAEPIIDPSMAPESPGL